MLDHKISPNNFRKTKIIWSIFSDHNHIKLALQEKNWRKTQVWKPNNIPQKDRERERWFLKIWEKMKSLQLDSSRKKEKGPNK